MSDTLPPVPPIEERRLILAIAGASEALAALALAALAAGPILRTSRMGTARLGFHMAVRRLDELLGSELTSQETLSRQGVNTWVPPQREGPP